MAVTAPTLLLSSAFLHALWNTTTKLSRDKDVFVFLTVLFACLIVSAGCLIQNQPFEIGGRTSLGFSMLAGVFEGGYLIAMARGFSRISMARAYSIMRGGAMVLVWGVSLSLAMESFTWFGLAGSAIVLFGIFVTGIRLGEARKQIQYELGWPLAGAAFIAGYHICYGECLKFGAEPKALFVTSLTLSLPFILVSARKNFWNRAKLVLRSESLRLILSSLGASFSFIIFLYGLRGSGPGYAITLRNTSIFYSIAFSFLIKESLTKHQVVGAFIIGLGAMVLSVW